MAATAVADASGSSSEVLGGWDFASLAEAVQDQDAVTPPPTCTCCFLVS